MNVKRPRLLLVAVFMLSASCGNGVAATVGTTKISEASIDRELAAIASDADYISYLGRTQHITVRTNGRWTKPFLASVVNQRVDLVAIDRIAEREHVSPSKEQTAAAPAYAAQDVGGPAIYRGFPSWYRRELARREALVAALRVNAIRTETAQSYYDRNKTAFIKYCTSDIVTQDQNTAETARDEILGGAPFADVARSVSIDRGTGPRGGDLGCNGPTDLLPQLNRAAAAQPVGVVGAPIKTDAGWHLLLVRSRATPPLDRVRGEVQAAVEELATQRVGRALRAWLEHNRVSVAGKYGSWDERSEKVVA